MTPDEVLQLLRRDAFIEFDGELQVRPNGRLLMAIHETIEPMFGGDEEAALLAVLGAVRGVLESSSATTPATGDPDLSPDVLADEQQLGEALEVVLQGDDELRTLSSRVSEEQELLRALLDDDTWTLLLRLDALVGDRNSLAQEVLVKWAFEMGVRFGGRR